MKSDIYQIVTDRIIAGLEAAQAEIAAGRVAELPWVKAKPLHPPMNVEGRPYNGVNWVVLSMLQQVFPSQVFATYKGWQAKGCQVRKGERGIPVTYWNTHKYRDTATGEDKQYAFIRGYTVFAGEQVEGYDVGKHMAESRAKLPNKAQAIAAADNAVKEYFARSGCGFRSGSNQAAYSSAADLVMMPAMAAFQSTEAYYSVMFHELGHSTGHDKRLARIGGKRFGDHAYAVEELVAEFSAAMMCARLGIESFNRMDHAHYVASWLRALKDNSKIAIGAAAAAQKAADMVLGKLVSEEASELAEAA